MDASTRSFHVYGKTASGANAIKAARGALTTKARRVLILVDGQRSVGELCDMLGLEAVETALAELEVLGHIEFLRRFTESNDRDADAAQTQADVVAESALAEPPPPPEPPLPVPEPPSTMVRPASALADAAASTAPAAPINGQAGALAATKEQPPAKADQRSATPAPMASASVEKAVTAPAQAQSGIAGAKSAVLAAAGPVAMLTANSLQRPASPATLQGHTAVQSAPTPVPAASPPASAPSAPALPNAQRPAPKPVVWQPAATAPMWARVLIVVGGIAAIGVWLSARFFLTDPPPRIAPATSATVGTDVAAPQAAAVAAGGAPGGAPLAPLAASSAAPAQAPVALPAPAPDSAAAVVPVPPAVAGAPAAVPPAPPAPVTTTQAPVRTGTLALPADTAGTPAHAPPSNAPAAPAARTLHVHTQFTPEIPKPVRDRGITSGHVAVVLHVDPQGRVERVELLSASPADVYDRNMEQVFAKWTFDPLGIPGRMTVDVDIRPPH